MSADLEVGSRWYCSWTYSMAEEYRGSAVIDGHTYHAWAHLHWEDGAWKVASRPQVVYGDDAPGWAPRIPMTPEVENVLIWNATHQPSEWRMPPGCAREVAS